MLSSSSLAGKKGNASLSRPRLSAFPLPAAATNKMSALASAAIEARKLALLPLPLLLLLLLTNPPQLLLVRRTFAPSEPSGVAGLVSVASYRSFISVA